jgi:Uma2 family endonuclease
MSAEPLPDWLVPPPGGWTADDMDRLPAEAPHCELLDGQLIVMSPHRTFHSRVIWKLCAALDAAAPPGWQIDLEFALRLDARSQPEPDVVVQYPSALLAPDRTWYPPSDVALAVEVVSPESRVRDRVIKPRKYAAAGIPQFWRIEEEDGAPVVYVFALDGDRYVETVVERQKLVLDQPFALSIDLGRLWP